MPLASASKLGPYEITAPLGAGGMGEVYRARDTRLQRDVAVKVLPAGFAQDPDRLHRFEQEARATAALNHPNILAIFDIGTTNGQPYVVTELLEGVTLRESLHTGPLPVRRAVEYALHIAHGLAAAHEKGIVHRDLKPENLFITKDGRVKILDFGLAKLTQIEPELAQAMATQSGGGTTPGVVLGTMGYMSPEQVRSVTVDARSDLFSFGAILYEMLSGKRAFHGDSAAETMSAILKEDPADLTETNRNISPALERIVRHCLEKNPEARFHSASDLGFALESVSGTSTVSASVHVTTRRSKRRLYALLASAATTVALLALGWWWLGSRSSHGELPHYQQVTFQLGTIGKARFTPDASIVYSAAWDGGPYQLYLARSDNPGARELGLKDAEVLSISKNSEMAVRMNAANVGGWSRAGTLARVSLSGGAPREVLENVQDADWAGNGEDMAIVRYLPEKRFWHLEYPIGKVLYDGVNWISHPKISPDGKLVAFADHQNPDGDDRGVLAYADSDGHEKILSKTFGGIQGIVWSPSGDEIWFSAATGNSGGYNIYAATLSGKIRALATMPGGMMLEDWHNRQALGVSLQHRVSIRGVGPRGGVEKNLGWLGWSILHDMTPDGNKILFDEEAEGGGPNYTIYIRDTDGSPPVRLGEGEALAISPDGKWVVSEPANKGPLRLIPVGAGDGRQLTHDKIEYSFFGQFTPDGQHLFTIGAEPGHAPRNYMIDITNGDSKPVTPEGVVGIILSPDGKRTVVIDAQGDYEIRQLESGASQKIPRLNSKQYAAYAWARNGEELYILLTKWAEGIPTISRVNIVNGKINPYKPLGLSERAGLANFEGIFFSKDERAYAYSYSQILSQAYVVTGLK